MTKVIRYR